MANVHLGLLLALVTFHGVYQIVEAVACAKDSDCVSTDNVLPKCTSGLCECKSGFYPITTGCGTRLPKPTVSFDDVSSDDMNYGTTTTEAYDKATVTLKCLSSGGSEMVRYVWSENGNIIAGETGTGPRYQFTADINKNSVAYSCKATLPDALDSFESDTFQVTVIGADAAPSGKPRIISDDIAATGSYTGFICTDLPIGTPISDIELKDGDTSISSSWYRVLANSQITCQYKGKISNPLEIFKENSPKPTIKLNVNRREIKFIGQVHTVSPNDHVYLSCTLPDYEISSPDMTYEYYKNSVLVPKDNYRIFVDTSTLGTNEYSCSGQYTSGLGTKLKETKSDTLTIVVQADTPLLEPYIILKPDNGNIGGHVSLKCLTNDIDVKYEWKKNWQTIYGQSDKVIQLHNVQLSSKLDTYVCKIRRVDGGKSTSSQILHAETLPPPTLSVTGATSNGLATLTAGNTFPLVCQLAAAPNGTQYRFYKQTFRGARRIEGILASVTQQDNGRYTCAAYFNNEEMSISNDLVITVGA